MILTTSEIIKQQRKGNIFISNFDESKVNPNSYNLTLNREMIRYTGWMDAKGRTESLPEHVTIPVDGYLLQPGILYLGSTNELTISKKHIPMLEGRSSIARLGITTHISAGFGDIGFHGHWTLEISVVRPVKIYPDIEIVQIYWMEGKGKAKQYEGKYQRNHGVQGSRMWMELKD